MNPGRIGWLQQRCHDLMGAPKRCWLAGACSLCVWLSVHSGVPIAAQSVHQWLQNKHNSQPAPDTKRPARDARTFAPANNPVLAPNRSRARISARNRQQPITPVSGQSDSAGLSQQSSVKSSPMSSDTTAGALPTSAIATPRTRRTVNPVSNSLQLVAIVYQPPLMSTLWQRGNDTFVLSAGAVLPTRETIQIDAIELNQVVLQHQQSRLQWVLGAGAPIELTPWLN